MFKTIYFITISEKITCYIQPNGTRQNVDLNKNQTIKSKQTLKMYKIEQYNEELLYILKLPLKEKTALCTETHNTFTTHYSHLVF